MKTTKILGAVMALTIAAAPTLGFSDTVTKTLITSPITAEAASAQWIQIGNKWKYLQSDGTYAKSKFKKIDGKWYHFNKNCWMDTGWLYLNGNWYYLGTDGARYENRWLYDTNGNWYYLGEDGVMYKGWRTINGVKHLFDENGVWIRQK